MSDATDGLLDWTLRAARLVDLRDLAKLLQPSSAFAKVRDFATGAHRGVVPGDDLSARDPELVRLFMDLFRALGKYYFRLQILGITNVPPEGPALLVGSHNGGLLTTDSYFTILAIWDHFGPERVLHGLAHDVVYDDPTLAKYAGRLGVLRAGHTGAHRALEAGHLVLVYPGSDLDTFRTWKDRHKIELGGRTGFIKLALRTGVPIVPVVSTGTHEQFVVLARGDAVVRALGLKGLFRSEVLPLAFALPWGVTIGYLPYLPLPAQTSVAFGEPISWPALDPRDADDAAVVSACYRDVERRMQATLDPLAEGRVPFFGKRST